MEARGLSGAVALLGALAVVSLTGCGGDDDAASSESEGSGEEVFSLVDIKGCVEENGYTVENKGLTPSPPIGLIASLPVLDSGGGLIQVIEFETEADAEAYGRQTDGGEVVGKFVVDPGDASTPEDVELMSACLA